MSFEDGLQAVKTSTVNNVLGAHGKQQTINVTKKGIDLAYDVGFLAGASSRQGEIGELKKELEILQGMHNAVSLVAGDLVEERDELQNRIDEALSAVWNDKCSHTVIDILKGNKND